MHDISVRLEEARRQAQQAQARVARQQALVDALAREGSDAVRAQRMLREMTLLADLLRDHAAQLEAQCGEEAFAPPGGEDWIAPVDGWRAAAEAQRTASRLRTPLS